MKALLLGLLVLAGRCFADGIPVTAGKVDTPHEIITLNTSQAEEIETLGTLTLTKDQFEKLRLIGPFCPKRFETVLPVSWDDCTCDMDCYAIQLSEKEVAVTHSQIEWPAWRDLELRFSEVHQGLSFRADRRGQFYWQGTLIPFPKLLELLKASDGKAKPGNIPDKNQICIKLPVGTSPDSAVFSDRLGKLREAATKAGWSFYAK